MLPQYSIGYAVIVFSLVATTLIGALAFFSWCVRPIRRRIEAEETYECGMQAQGDARGLGFNFIGYAALFLLFDLAALYLFLYAVMERPPVAVSVSFLLGLLTLGLIIVYASKRRKYYVA